MKDYPRLTKMGIMHPKQIVKFSVNGMSTYDVLRVVYERRKGSPLPSSRTYKFPRVQQPAVVNHEKDQVEDVMMTNPELKEALVELDDLLKKKKHKHSVSAMILEELESLEEEVANRSECIRDLLRQL